MEMEQGVEETGLLRKISGKFKNFGALDAAEVGNDTVSSELADHCKIAHQEGEEKSSVNGSDDEEKAAGKEGNGSLPSHGVFSDNDKEIEPGNATNKEEEKDTAQEEITNNGSIDNTNEIEDVDEEFPTEYEVETVIRKQNTHNLYCPKCRSCITRTVKLRRKRRVKRPSNNLPNEPSEIQRKPDDSPTRPSDTESQLTGEDEDGNDNGKVVFRCLSCFSYFIPTGNGFKLFRCFGDDGENCLSSIFASGRKKSEINKGSHVIPIEDSPQEDSPQGAQVVPAEAESNQRDTNQCDIIKSIVYGGLVESITSVGVVSSAVAADTSTLKVIALGMANLIGGLFVIAHNLVELKRGEYTANATRLSEREDRYQELLGRRQNFPLHMTVAILSYLLFGSVPPVIYGFSFPQSCDRDLKLAVAAGASLLCIAVLAFAKAHVRRPPKRYIETIFQFVLTGASAAGVSYLAGRLINRLMEKLWLDIDQDLSVSYPGATEANLGWAYY